MPELVPLHALFTIEHGNKLDMNKMVGAEPSSSDAVAFVGRSGERNGVVAFVTPLSQVAPYAAGLITVALGGQALASFVQPRAFYTAQNVDVLTPISEMSLDTKLYYCLCVQTNRFRYSTFGREANRTLRDLRVPALSSLPPWVKGATSRAVAELQSDLTALPTV